MSKPGQTNSQGIQPSCFASAERVGLPTLREQQEMLGFCPLSAILLESGASNILILNEQRQIVAAGKRAMALLSVETIEQLLGKRPGEAVHCIHAENCTGGCGTSEYCKECGAVRAIITGLSGTEAQQECRILVSGSGVFQALDLRITATPFIIQKVKFVVLAIEDTSHEKRRCALERVFFHDVLNLAGGIEGLLELMRGEDPERVQSMLDMSLGNIRDLREEVVTQRDLHSAELNELKPSFGAVSSIHLLLQVISAYKMHPVCHGKQIMVSADSELFDFYTDPVLMKRILGNLIKNAAEASHRDETITARCFSNDTAIFFSIHNASVIPVAVQHQIFQRSFSTKGAGRGLGTYSVKLFTEKYLSGIASFESSIKDGTTFVVQFPLRK